MSTRESACQAGPSDSVQTALTLTEALRHRAHTPPHKPAFIFRHPASSQRHELTFADLYTLGGHWARALHEKGVGRGQYVVNALPNSPERAVVEAAILLSGAASVNGNCQMSDASDLKAVLGQSAAVALVVDPDIIPEAYCALLRDVSSPGEDGSVTSQSLPDLKYVLQVRRRDEPAEDFLSGLDHGGEVYHDQELGPEDVCTVFTTSGSTGFSKLVVFTHGTFMAMVKTGKFESSAVELNMSQMGWSAGYMGYAIMKGSTRVCCDIRAGLPQDLAFFILKSIRGEGVTDAFLPIFVLPQLEKLAKAETGVEPLLAKLDLGTQPITHQIIEVACKVARTVMVSYASSEMLLIAFAFGVDPSNHEDYLVGSVMPGVEVKVRDQQGLDAELGTRGEILVKTPFRFQGYLHDASATAAAFTSDGFFCTGDIGWFNAYGKLFVEGRTNDAIMRGNIIIYPGWLESRIRSCSVVNDVMVVGVPDAMLSSEVCACVVLKPEGGSIQDVREFVENDIMAGDNMSPRPRHYLLFDAFPLTATNKSYRKEVKRLAALRIQNDQSSMI